jgi:S1-C subfamily serine protease
VVISVWDQRSIGALIPNVPSMATRRRKARSPRESTSEAGSIAAQLEAHGKVARGYLGLGLQPVRLDREGGVGAMVMSVDAKGPGAKAGLRQGDIIQAWDGQPIASFNALLRKLGPASVGKTVTLSLRRGGESIAVDLEIGERLEA